MLHCRGLISCSFCAPLELSLPLQQPPPVLMALSGQGQLCWRTSDTCPAGLLSYGPRVCKPNLMPSSSVFTAVYSCILARMTGKSIQGVLAAQNATMQLAQYKKHLTVPSPLPDRSRVDAGVEANAEQVTKSGVAQAVGLYLVRALRGMQAQSDQIGPITQLAPCFRAGSLLHLSDGNYFRRSSLHHLHNWTALHCYIA